MGQVALLNLSGRDYNGKIELKWKPPSGAPDTVYIYRVNGNQPINANPQTQPLHTCPHGLELKFPKNNDAGISRLQFLVFLGERYAIPDIDAMIHRSEYIVTVMTGTAKVQYDIKEKELERGFVQHTIIVKPDCDLPQGILLYSFDTVGYRYSVPFPDNLESGKLTCPSFYTQPGARQNKRNGSCYGLALEVSAEARQNIKLEYRKFGFPFY